MPMRSCSGPAWRIDGKGAQLLLDGRSATNRVDYVFKGKKEGVADGHHFLAFVFGHGGANQMKMLGLNAFKISVVAGAGV